MSNYDHEYLELLRASKPNDNIGEYNLANMEKSLIRKALVKHAKGTHKEAALELGIAERTLYRKMNEYGL